MADYALEVARLCFDNKVYVCCVFFCHLALEKLLKAIVLDRLSLEEPPHTHNLGRLVEIGEVDLSREQMRFLVELTPFATAARYPDPLAEYDEEQSQAILARAQEVYTWLRLKLT